MYSINLSRSVLHHKHFGAVGVFGLLFLAPMHIVHTVYTYCILLADASKNGVAQEAMQNIKRASKTMTEAEARQILGVTENSSWEEIVQVRSNVLSLSCDTACLKYDLNILLLIFLAEV